MSSSKSIASPFKHRNVTSQCTGSEKRKRNKSVHIRQEEFDCLFRKLRYQLPRGKFIEATGTLASFIADKKTGESQFDDYERYGEVPIGLSRLDFRTVALLDSCGIYTLSELEELTDAQFAEIPGFSTTLIRKARKAQAALTREFLTWQAKRQRGQSR